MISLHYCKVNKNKCIFFCLSSLILKNGWYSTIIQNDKKKNKKQKLINLTMLILEITMLRLMEYVTLYFVWFEEEMIRTYAWSKIREENLLAVVAFVTKIF